MSRSAVLTQPPPVVAARSKIVVKDATKYYHTRSGAVHALDAVSLDVRKGEFLCILGPSGCGKSTLLWSMAGPYALSGGEIRLDGERIAKPHPAIAMIFQDANLLPWRNLIENVAFPFEIKRRRPDRERDERRKWGYHILESWKLFFDTGREIGQISGDFRVEDVVKNDWVDEANSFDAAKVRTDADGFQLSDAFKSVDVKAVQAAL